MSWGVWASPRSPGELGTQAFIPATVREKGVISFVRTNLEVGTRFPCQGGLLPLILLQSIASICLVNHSRRISLALCKFPLLMRHQFAAGNFIVSVIHTEISVRRRLRLFKSRRGGTRQIRLHDLSQATDG